MDALKRAGEAKDKITELAQLEKRDHIQFAVEVKQVAKQRAIHATAVRKAARLKRLEHTNGSGDCRTQTRTPEGSSWSSNGEPVRTAEDLYEAAKDIIEAPDVLAKVGGAISASGYAGDTT